MWYLTMRKYRISEVKIPLGALGDPTCPVNASLPHPYVIIIEEAVEKVSL